MDEQKKVSKGRKPELWEALITLAALIAFLSVGIVIYHVDPHVPMFFGVCAAAIMALYLGYDWSEIEKAMSDGIDKALQSIMILAIIGILIGMWLDSGVVPAMIYYGLKIIKPQIFLLAAMLICSITSLATGTSWGTMGTMGVAMMGIGLGIGMNPAATAGAVLSGAYFGDKMSPLSDTTNLAPAMAGTDVFTHVKFMILPTAIVYTICIVFFTALGFHYYKGGQADLSSVKILSDTIHYAFPKITPLLLLPPVVVIVCVAKKMPAIPGITIGIFCSAIMGLILQPGVNACSIGSLFDCGRNGFVFEASDEVIAAVTQLNANADPELLKSTIAGVTDLLSTGGLMNMMSSIAMTIIAMMFGGIMETTHQLEVIVDKLKVLAKTPASLVTLTEATCLVSNMTMPEQYISIVVPGRMYAEEYRKMGLHPMTLSNALEGAGTVTSALVPWNTCGVFIKSTLGLTVTQYGPYAMFNVLMPITVIIMAFMGLTVADMDGVRLANKKKAAAK